MATKEVALDVASFLDSPQATALEQVRREDVRRITELFVEACYDDVGKKPRLLDGHDVHAILGHVLPGRLTRKDPLAAHVPAVLRAYLEHLAESQVVTQGFEQRRGLEETLDEFEEAVRTGREAHHHHGKRQEPVVHRAPKLGRNDPCFCGSGKKFKKCHGKET